MKTVLYLLLFFVTGLLSAQTATKEQVLSDLPELEVANGVNLHIISPEPIQYVDLSTQNLTGDLPNANIARIKIAYDGSSAGKGNTKTTLSLREGDHIGIITVVGQSFIAQYKAVYQNPENQNIVSNIHIQPEEMQPIELNLTPFSNQELRMFAENLIKYKPEGKPIREQKNHKLRMQLNNVYVISDYIFLDLTFKNSSKLSYDIEDLKFSIEDKKIYRATNNQRIEMPPLFRLYAPKHFRKTFRNIYVFKKFTFPNSKVMVIRLIEEQFSGRIIEMKVNYSDILKADTF